MYSIEEITKIIIESFDTENPSEFNRAFMKEPKVLYQPIEYAMSQGGKRIRPLLVLMAADMFGGDLNKALYPAHSIEILHNFTLLHDDIMDVSAIRRGMPTIYKKFGTNAAILSGDTMCAISYRYLLDPGFAKLSTNEERIDLLATLSLAFVEVCEGQALDMEFETRDDVSIEEYIEMIRLKTSALIASSLKMGAIIAGAKKEDIEYIYKFGEYIGLAFQFQDDILDCWSNFEEFGKLTGKDIEENKKTFLYLKALELGSEEEKKELRELYSGIEIDKKEKEERVMSIYERLEIRSIAFELMKDYNQKAIESLEKISLPDNNKANLISFAESLMKRNN